MLSGVDWLGVLKKVKDEIIMPAWSGFWDGLMSDGKNYIIGTLGKIGTWFKESFWGPFARIALTVVGAKVIKGAWEFFKKDVWLGTLRGFLFDKTAEGAALTGADAFFKSLKYVIFNRFVDIGNALHSIGHDTIVTGLGDTIATSTGLLDMLTGVGEWIGSLAGPIAAVTAVVVSLTSAYGGLGGVIERIKQVFSDAFGIIKAVMDKLGATESLNAVKDAFGRLGDSIKALYDSLAGLKPL